MHKAITVILFKLEGQKVMRRPEYGMDDRLLLDKIDYENKTLTIGEITYPLEDCDFPTVDPADPYTLTEEEEQVIDQLTASFRRSEKLQRHVRFLYSKGSMYLCYNGNLLFHGCIPMTEDGRLMSFTIGGKERSGRDFLNYAEKAARKAYYDAPGSAERQNGMDFLWWLWAGRNSPIFWPGPHDHLRTAAHRRRERLDRAQEQPITPCINDPAVCEAMLLKEFGLEGPHCHIINGHIPVKAKKGESPIKGGGKLIVIDGGFCKAYQPTSGIAGYTLIFNSWCFRIVSHQPFAGRQDAIENDHDIGNSSDVFERLSSRMRISETDIGRTLQAQSDDLCRLLEAYRSGAVTEDHKE